MRKKLLNLSLQIFFVGILTSFPLGELVAQDIQKNNNGIIWDKVLLDKVIIKDPELINFFTEQFFITETPVNRLDIYDVTGNGFGEKDIIEVYPSRSIYFLDFVMDSAQQLMNTFQPEDHYNISGINDDPGAYDVGKAESGILASLLLGVKWNVRQSPVKIWFRQDSSGYFKFEMLGYNEESLKYTPPWPQQSFIQADTITVGDSSFVVPATVNYDILREFLRQSVSDPSTDLLKIYISRSDTIYVDSKAIRKKGTN